MHILIFLIAIILGHVSTAFAQQTVVGERLRIAQESDLSGDVGHPDYISQLQRWLITQEGAGDFRYLFTDEMHAKAFIADLEQALAGGQIITKSVTTLATNYSVPAAGAASTITVKDLPSAENMAVFESGDTIRLRTFSRASGSLTIADAYGVVTSYVDQAGGVQDWTFTRNSGADAGAMTAGTTIQADAIVLDYGVSGNGYYEVNAIDGLYGVNSPYARIATWTTSPIGANQTIRTQLGNLKGITGTTGEYGLIAGSYDATPDNNTSYFRASNNAFELVGINLSLYDGASRTFHFDRSTPYFSMGNGAPSAYGTGVGCWQGKDAGVYKWRCGNPSGDRIEWDGTTLNVVGTITVTGGGSAVSWNDLTDRPTELTDGRVATALASTGRLLNTVNAAPSGSGLFLGADKMGFYSGGAWQTYMDNAGNFYLGGTSGSLQWNGTTLTIAGSGTFTGSVTASSGTIGGWTIGASTLTGGVTTLNANGNITVGSGNNVARLSDDATYRMWVGHATASSAPFRVTVGGAMTAASGTIGDWTISSSSLSGGTLVAGGGAVTLDDSGIQLLDGTGGTNKINWDDGSSVYSFSGTLFVNGNSTVAIAGTNTVYFDTRMYPQNNNNTDIGTSALRFRDLWISRNVDLQNDLFADGNFTLGGDFVWTPPTTTSSDQPVVYSVANGILYRKTNGHSGTCNSNIVVQGGIITSCSP